MLVTRTARPEELEKVVNFYQDHDYSPPVNPADILVWQKLKVCFARPCAYVRSMVFLLFVVYEFEKT
jgi:hypothetical protein